MILLLFLIIVPGFGILRGLISGLGLMAERVLAKLPIVHTFDARGRRRREFSSTGHALAGAGLFIGHTVAFVVPIVVLIVGNMSILVM